MAQRIIDLRKKKPSARTASRSALRTRAGERVERPGRLREKRRRRRILAGFFIFALVAAALYGVHYASYLPQFQIGDISVEGAKRLPPELVLAFVEAKIQSTRTHFLSPSNIFVYKKSAIERSLVDFFPRVRSATLARESFLATPLNVLIVERAPYAEWCEKAIPDETGTIVPRCFVVDDIGFVFASSELAELPSSSYVFSGGLSGKGVDPIGKTFIPGHLPGLLGLFKQLQNAGFSPEGAVIENEKDFSVPLAEGFTIKASFGANLSALTRDLELVLSSEALRNRTDELEYVDLRFGNRVYYKFRGGAKGEL